MTIAFTILKEHILGYSPTHSASIIVCIIIDFQWYCIMMGANMTLETFFFITL